MTIGGSGMGLGWVRDGSRTIAKVNLVILILKGLKFWFRYVMQLIDL